MSTDRAARRLACYYAALFSAVGISVPFTPVWLASRGLDAREIGFVLATMMAVRVAVNPLVAALADRLGARRRLVQGLAIGGFLACLPLGFAQGFWPVLLLMSLYVAIYAPVMPLAESLSLATMRQQGLDYGRLRLWGSVSFIAASVGAGWLIAGRPESLILWLIAGCIAATAIATQFLPAPEMPPSPPRSRPVRRLLARPLFLLMVLAAALNMASHSILHGFGTLHWRALGHGDDAIGLLWALGVVGEIVLFAVAGGLTRRIGPIAMLVVGAAAGLARWLGLAYADAYWALAALQLLHALTFGATHLGATYLLQNAIPATVAGSAQALYSSLSMGVIVGLTTLFSGHMYAAWGSGAFLVMAGLSAASAGAALLLGRNWRPGAMLA
ncbi:MAG: MFS transporter [Alphaproteobacteria bacterium]|nr:MFS transporter [Alphaproteobacteria bacterium]